MNSHLKSVILSASGAVELVHIGLIQSLWSGYGSIVRYGLNGSAVESVVVKHVSLPESLAHPRGWNTDFSHQRKLKSYAVETMWYRNWSERCGADCRVPKCLALESHGQEMIIVMEDLHVAGYGARLTSLSREQLRACLCWLANFHATFMGVEPTGLWASGTYWHLQTRPDELLVLAREDPELKDAAAAIDQRLRRAKYQTLIHGDAKLANFCFSQDGTSVAAVDFQYTGRGCGMKDVYMLMSSSLSEEDCECFESEILEYYFGVLRVAIMKRGHPIELDHLETEWRGLYPYAVADFQRFLKGWSPGHWKSNAYSEKITRRVVLDVP